MPRPTVYDFIAEARSDPVNYYRYRIERNPHVQFGMKRGQLSNEIIALAVVILQTGTHPVNIFIGVVREWREKMSYLFDEQ